MDATFTLLDPATAKTRRFGLRDDAAGPLLNTPVIMSPIPAQSKKNGISFMRRSGDQDGTWVICTSLDARLERGQGNA